MSHTEEVKVKDMGVTPEWIVADNWAVGVDPMNWKLYRRMPSGKWKVLGYYGSVAFLLRDMRKQIERIEDPKSDDVVTHLVECSIDFEKTVLTLYEKLGITDARDLKDDVFMKERRAHG